MGNLSKIKRIELLLSKGYFPEELPNVFTTLKFGNDIKNIRKSWKAKEPKRTQYYSYSIPRDNLRRRSLAITNPTSQYFLAELISDNWSTIRKHMKKSKISEFQPEFSSNYDRAILPINWPGIENSKRKFASRQDSIFKTDIQRFYQSIYTHSLSWALHGKVTAKNLQHDKKLLGNKIDLAVRQCQGGQSIGIPVGPDTSRLLSEIIAVELDVGIQKHLTESKEYGIRYVDDYFIGCQPDRSENFYIKAFINELSYLELDINYEKTRLLPAGTTYQKEWYFALSELSVPALLPQAKAINRFFSTAMEYAEKYPNDPVLLFAIRKAQSFFIQPNNWRIFEWNVLQIARAESTCLADAAQLIAQGLGEAKPVELSAIKKFALSRMANAIEIEAEHEALWCIFLLRALKVSLSKSDLKALTEWRPSLASLVALELKQIGKANFSLPKSWSQECIDGDLFGPNWLFIYESIKKNWINTNIIDLKKVEFFSELNKRDIEFYDTSRNFWSSASKLKHQRLRNKLLSLQLSRLP